MKMVFKCSFMCVFSHNRHIQFPMNTIWWCNGFSMTCAISNLSHFFFLSPSQSPWKSNTWNKKAKVNKSNKISIDFETKIAWILSLRRQDFLFYFIFFQRNSLFTCSRWVWLLNLPLLALQILRIYVKTRSSYWFLFPTHYVARALHVDAFPISLFLPFRVCKLENWEKEHDSRVAIELMNANRIPKWIAASRCTHSKATQNALDIC